MAAILDFSKLLPENANLSICLLLNKIEILIQHLNLHFQGQGIQRNQNKVTTSDPNNNLLYSMFVLHM